MKLFAKFMIAALFIAMLLPFTILKGPDGRTLMSLSDINLPNFSLPKLPSLPKMPDASSIGSADDSLRGKDIFYKWYDAQGNVQFTTEPPAEGIEYTVKGFDPDTNLIQAVEMPEPEPAPDESSPNEQKAGEPGVTGNPYSRESIDKLYEDAKNIEKVLQQRFQDQESTLNQ